MSNEPDQTPLYVDLDGTLIATDLLWESLIALLRTRPLDALQVPFWVLRGRSYVKSRLAERAQPDLASLPYRPEVLAYLNQQRDQGRRIVLATASERRLAQGVCDHLGLFDSALGTEENLNLKGRNKLAAIQRDCGPDGFDYMGDSAADLPIWQAARQAILVHPPASVRQRAEAECASVQVIETPASRLKPALKAMRPHQWAKNVLLFVPLITAHRFLDPAALLPAVLAFVAFCLVASAVYILNDLFDLPSDRAHPRKRRRPLASGALKIPAGLALMAALLAAAAGLTVFLPWKFNALLLTYVVLTTLYSTYFKRKLMVDVICLAALYTLRILAGGAATDIEISPWLMAFSMFFFLSLAFAKRYIELSTVQSTEVQGRVAGRGYQASDLDMIRTLGPTSGYLCVLVFCLYINSPDLEPLYKRPQFLWLACPVLLYWISRIWFLAERRQLPHDPVVFALRDRYSYVAGVLIGLILLAAL